MMKSESADEIEQSPSASTGQAKKSAMSHDEGLPLSRNICI